MRSCPRCSSPYSAQVEFCGLDGTRLQEYDADPLIGSQVDRYRILELLGKGAMARVYRAAHRVLDHEYALKVLFGEIASNPDLAERFRREAQVISKLNHPNVVSVVDFGTTEAGLTYLTMELVRGRMLREVLKAEGPFSPLRAARILRQIASGLAEAHGRGFVHRDLKPSNIMIVEEGSGERVKILDFGLVRAASEGAEEGHLTKTGQFLGTPLYMSPEQILGAEITPQADLYALGVVLFEMLEGRPPFKGNKIAEIRQQHMTGVPPPIRPSLGLETLARLLLEKAPERRPRSAEEVIAVIDLAFVGDAMFSPTLTEHVSESFHSVETTVRAGAAKAGPLAVASEDREPPLLHRPVDEVQEGVGQIPPSSADTGQSPLARAGVLGGATSLLRPPLSFPIAGDRTPPVDVAREFSQEAGPTRLIRMPVELSSAESDPRPRFTSSLASLDLAEASQVDSPMPPLRAPRPTAKVAIAGIAGAALAAALLVASLALQRAGSSRDSSMRSVSGESRAITEVPRDDASRPTNLAPSAGSKESEIAPDRGRAIPRAAAASSAPERGSDPRRDAKDRAEGSAPASPTAQPKKARAAPVGGLDAALAKELQRRGLSTEDIDLLPSVAPKWERWRIARAERNPSLMATAHSSLVSSIREAPINPALVRRKLDRVSDALNRASSAVPVPTLSMLEDRYLDLAKAAAGNPDERQCALLAGKASELLREITSVASAP